MRGVRHFPLLRPQNAYVTTRVPMSLVKMLLSGNFQYIVKIIYL